jgi:hypothetical protein
MSFHSWLQKLRSALATGRGKSKYRRQRSVQTATQRLNLEALEDRNLPSFFTPVGYPVGRNPDAIVTADFNGDGKLDLATADLVSSTVSVLLGNGDGTFQPAVATAAGGYPRSLAVGDFNGDGNLDIVTANVADVSVLLGNGDGTFRAPTSIGLNGDSALSVAVGDFNRDGKMDLAVTSNLYFRDGYFYGYYGGRYPFGHYEGHVQVLLDNGDGTFSPPNTTVLNSGMPSAVAVADVNADGKPDLVTANESPPTISVLLGKGDGTLQAPVDFAAGGGPMSIAAGDVNGDGHADVVIGDGHVDVVTGDNNCVSVLLGNGLGAFGAYHNYATGGNRPSVALADLNADGKLDLVTANQYSADLPNSVSVLLGNGNGTFRANQNFLPWGALHGVAAADFNGDGRPDLAVADAANGGAFVLLNDGAWPAPAAQASNFAVSGYPSPATAGAAHPLTVTALDNLGNPLTSYIGTIHFSSSDVQASLPADYTFTAADGGTHTFSVTLKTAGTQSLTVTDNTTGSVTGSEAGIIVKAAAASTMSVAGFPSAIMAGVAGTFTVTLRDGYGNIASGYTGTVHISSSDTKASLPANYTFTAADAGVHVFSAILKTAGTRAITGKDTVTGSLTGTEGNIKVNPAAATRFLISAPASVTGGVAFRLTVTVTDAYGNVVTGYTGTIHFKSTDGSATLPANYTFTVADKGLRTFTGVILRTKSKQTISATDPLNNLLSGSVDVVVRT